ncbi:MAG: alanyl-tRNA editing protein [Ahrensia sp.]|nr:alanyl-tRNA editing protein [Ahrensia sp.]
MKTDQLFADDAYLKSAQANVLAITGEGGIVLDRTPFYANSGGQPGDSGYFEREDGTRFSIATTVYERGGKSVIVHVPEAEAPLPAPGERLTAIIDWERRLKLMKMHTACHLLSVVCPEPITGAAVNEQDSRIDFDMSETADKRELSEKLMELVAGNHPVYTQWITEDELDANPDLVRSKNVKPPRGLGKIRLVCIGENAVIDSQPCGGTHVTNTREIGPIHIGKIEKKGRENRRMRIRFGPLPA